MQLQQKIRMISFRMWLFRFGDLFPISATTLVFQSEQNPNDDRVAWLYREINQLNEIDRSLCLMLLDDFSYKEMADIVGISESNVAVKIHRLKKHLAEKSKNKTLIL